MSRQQLLGMDELSPETEEAARRARRRISREYVVYAETQKRHPNSALRIAQLILVVPLIQVGGGMSIHEETVQRIVHRYQATFQYSTILQMHNLEEDIVNLQIDSF